MIIIGMTGALSQLDALAHVLSVEDVVDSWPSWMLRTLYRPGPLLHHLRSSTDSKRRQQSPSTENVPKASKYFLSFVLMQVFLFAAFVLLQGPTHIGRVWRHYKPLSPRDQLKAVSGRRVDWGTVYQIYTNNAWIDEAKLKCLGGG